MSWTNHYLQRGTTRLASGQGLRPVARLRVAAAAPVREPRYLAIATTDCNDTNEEHTLPQLLRAGRREQAGKSPRQEPLAHPLPAEYAGNK